MTCSRGCSTLTPITHGGSLGCLLVFPLVLPYSSTDLEFFRLPSFFPFVLEVLNSRAACSGFELGAFDLRWSLGSFFENGGNTFLPIALIFSKCESGG